jgi:pyruvate dehydrogenase E2 component (dihydrolipoamide acetyltransferase)
MLTKITMPSGGTNTDQLLVVSWKKNVGDTVKRGDILIDVETDKAVLEVESFAQGTLLKRMVEEGSYGTVGEVIAYLGKPEDLKQLEAAPAANEATSAVPDAEELDDFMPIVALTTPPAPQSTPEPSRRKVKATPAAKKEVRDRGLDLAAVHQRVGKDILRRSDVAAFSRQPASSSQPLAASGDVMAGELIVLTPMRRIIAERLQAGASVPAFTAEIQVDMSGCIRLRSDLNTYSKSTKFAYHDIIAKCAAIAAGDFPLVNASFTDKGIRIFNSVNIGLAVSLPQGLVVPVVSDVRNKDIVALAQENAKNIGQVRSGKFDSKLLENGTLTISNLGKYPIIRFTAILNPPQSCILAIGAIQSCPVWIDGQFREQPTASITGTFDHRVVDGSYGAEFLTRLKQLLEHPHLLFIR